MKTNKNLANLKLVDRPTNWIRPNTVVESIEIASSQEL